ncbi:MAG: hypothetical protein ACFFDN_29015 [Candidatus Hodarchaeota archaeon]
MTNWKEARVALEKFYGLILGKDYGRFIDFKIMEDFNKPAWYDLNLEPIKLSKTMEIKEPGGLLLDPEVGIVCFFLEFKDENTTRLQISKSINFRSRLLPGPPEETNKINREKPEWRVSIHWLVENEELLSKWKEIISKIRNTSAHLEEVAVDVILVENNNLYKAIENHRLPRLLLYLRKVFRLTGPDQIYKWRSADELVKKMLQTLKEDVPNDLKPYYNDLVNYGLAQSIDSLPRKTQEANKQPKELSSLFVENFRNITERIKLELGPQRIPKYDGSDYVNNIAHIVYGPNGTGKTTLYEALEFAIVGCSERMKKFLEERENIRKNSNVYLEYLKPFENPNSIPKVGISEKLNDRVEINCEKNPREDRVASELKELMDAMLSQERIREFVHWDADLFSTEVMQDYSPLSSKLREYIDRNFNEASEKRKRLLNRLNLPPSFTILQHAKKAYVERLWSTRLPSLERSLIDLLEIFRKKEDIPAVAGVERVFSKLKDVIKTRKNVPNLDNAQDENVWNAWLQNYNNAVANLKQWYESLRKEAKKWQENNRLRDLALWSEWLNQKKKKISIDKQEALNLSKKLKELEKERDSVRRQGEIIKERLEEHFEGISPFLYNRWLPLNPDVCPTCNTKFEEEGGLEAIIENLKRKLTNEKEELRKSYRSLSEQIKDLKDKLAKIGALRIPIDESAQADISKMIEILYHGFENVEDIIMDDEKLDMVRKRADILMRGISIPESILEPDARGSELASQIKIEFTRMDDVWESPDRWKNLSEILNKRLAEIVKKHLPDTIGSLWWEIVMCMTSASWLPSYSDLKIKVENEKKSQLSVKNRKALYILNNAEIAVAGLGWFITRYLLEGRWKYRFMVIDDPAQGMDEVNYGEFCRFMYTLLFLHKRNKLPWSLVLFQRLEDQATISAKALYGVIHRLGWDSKSAPKLLETIEIAQGIWEIAPLRKAFQQR